MNSSNSKPSTYLDLFQQQNGHSLLIWVAFYIRLFLALIGITLNLALIVATIREKKLHTLCIWLITIETGCMALFLLHNLVTFAIAISGVNFIPLSLCFALQALPLFGLLVGFQVTLQIGLERLVAILFPIWSHQSKCKLLHSILISAAFVSCGYLLWLCFLSCQDVQTPVFCLSSDVTSRPPFYEVSFNRTVSLHILVVFVYTVLFFVFKCKKTLTAEHYSRNILKSLFVLVLIELVGWLPNFFLGKFFVWLDMSPIQITQFSAFWAILTNIIASLNCPVLYLFSQNYRNALNNLLCDIGICQNTHVFAWTSV